MTVHEPPMRLQRKTHMIPGEDCPDCVFCHAGLHEARPRLTDVLDAVIYCNATKAMWGRIDVDCPECGKPNEVSWNVNVADHTWDATARSKWTDADKRYAEQSGMVTYTRPTRLAGDDAAGSKDISRASGSDKG